MSTEKLPAPRLQLRWVESTDDFRYRWECHYELVLPLGEHDIRSEVYDDDGEVINKVDELVVAIKPPTRRGSDSIPCTAFGTGERYYDAPFRDGAHAKWAAALLGDLPIYVIAPDGMAFAKEADK